MSVLISRDFGIVVRRDALLRHGMHEQSLCSLMETAQAYDSDDELLSCGPHFGQEAADELTRRLQSAGLEYVVDFWCFASDIPEWRNVSCTIRH